ncbi:hypothetical protein SMD44_02194 [Streptomyces alboflavus]|uniref:Uncharacterized protein n=1 Tax=Streptomyces alboflavus TaxID=67267 RepID=A0A1Z1W8R2_9ACTN|nr:hypothetical protein SMD44_02194 [Streptomyces alboflavus]
MRATDALRATEMLYALPWRVQCVQATPSLSRVSV